MKKILSGVFLLVLLSGCSMTSNAPQSSPAVSPDATEAASDFIGEEKAKELALQKAGINADGVTFDRIELDRDDGVWQYEVDFHHEGIEYDIDIKADNGEILSFEKENKEAF